jgi:peroxiredoxin
MSIQVGDRVPECIISQMMENGPAEISTQAYFKGRRVVLFAVPGAFTPTCSAYHLPGFVEHLEEFGRKSVDAVACMSVNDVFVMHAWGKSARADGIDMLADGNGDFTRALGLEMDSRPFGMGMRSQRFALIAEDGIVTRLMVEAPGEFRVSSAEAVLASL